MEHKYEKLIMDLSEFNYENKVYQGFYNIHKEFKFGKTVIDLGCGHGKFSIMCRDLGYDVTGIDARNVRIPLKEKNITWKIQDVSTLDVIESDTVLYFGLLYHLNYEQQIKLLKSIKTNLLIINTHFAVIEDGEIKNITNKDKLSIINQGEIHGVIYEESKTLNSLKNRPLASFSNLTSFWPTLDCLTNMLINVGKYNKVYVVEPYLMSDRTYIVAKNE
jgi:SAM-dependent methyltransferase